MLKKMLAGAAFVACLAQGTVAEEIGEVTTAIKILGANHRIVIEVFEDPEVEGVSCFVSRARTGGISGSLGLAEDTPEPRSLARQTGPMNFREELKMAMRCSDGVQA